MNLDNSGNVVIFDSKTQEAIDLAKNRIDELNNDIARLQKAKQVEQADVKEAQDEKAYLESQLELLRPELDILTAQAEASKQESIDSLNQIGDQRSLLIEEKVALASEKEQNQLVKQQLEVRSAEIAERIASLSFNETAVQNERNNLTQIKQELIEILEKI